MSDEGLYNLRLAILRKAVADYKQALRDEDDAERGKIEWFFRSGWGETLSNGQGAAIIAESRKRIGVRRIATFSRRK